MNPTPHRVLLCFLALTGAVTGGWAYFAPVHWYDTFPGLGMSWLPQLGPYNEHFAKDVGAFFLGLTVLSVLAFICVANTTLVRVTAGTWAVFNLLHLILHLQMLHHYSPRDQVLNVVALSALLLASLALFIPFRRNDGSTGQDSRARSATGRPA
ncbi:hypothetical protein C6A87_010390 [Mycobacterium sp. ITM-2016-00317]|uniref:hypothetical protein n=1 Tax=Mycobacterium sp. ITM-2016-00317 TaxID=2099694 RepID=UPI00287F5CB9|nr:hypothetical protein [Mycobacterium sp. ITM-2016-00317]WNG89525.1 hypothetical protein C6A87_010390 [Mycobacterium sp. ITM-2016-00317]